MFRPKNWTIPGNPNKTESFLKDYLSKSLDIVRECYGPGKEELTHKEIKSSIVNRFRQSFEQFNDRQCTRRLAIFDVFMIQDDPIFQSATLSFLESTDPNESVVDFDQVTQLTKSQIWTSQFDRITFRDFCIVTLHKRLCGTLSAIRTPSDVGFFVDFAFVHMMADGMTDPIFDKIVTIVPFSGEFRLRLTSPKIPEIPESPESPQSPQIPVIPESPQIPEAPEISESPQIPEVPVIPDSPKIPDEDHESSERYEEEEKNVGIYSLLMKKDDHIQSLNETITMLKREREAFKYELSKRGVAHTVIDEVFFDANDIPLLDLSDILNPQ